jgi:glucosamine--fructose-6-phosphate aminotransferase (isomerizing)
MLEAVSDMYSSIMLDEALSAPARLREFLARDRDRYAELGARLRVLRPAVVATVARGSSDHAAFYAGSLVPACTGRVVASVPPSLVTVLGARLELAGQLVLAMSQGGGSPDIVRTVQAARSAGALVAAIVNDVTSPLAQATEVLLPQHAEPERSLSATKSVIATMAAIARLCAEWSEDAALRAALEALPEVLDRAAARTMEPTLLAGVSHVYVLSRALGHGAAAEVALKLKETCGLHAEAFSAAEVLHGPREIVDQRFVVIALPLPGSGAEDVHRAAADLAAQGARVISVDDLPAAGDPRLAPIVALQALYPWIARSSKALGRDPDRPRTLASKVIKTT